MEHVGKEKAVKIDLIPVDSPIPRSIWIEQIEIDGLLFFEKEDTRLDG